MVRYLNSQMREDVIVATGAADLLLDISKRWNSNMKNPPERFTKLLRSASSFTVSAMKDLNRQLDDAEVKRIYRMARTTKFQLKYEDHGFTSKDTGVITYDITEDERNDLSEALAEVRCTKCSGKNKECSVKDLFFKWDIDPIHEIVENGQCPYTPI